MFRSLIASPASALAVGAFALAAALAPVAAAQTGDRPVKMLTGPDQATLQAAVKEVKQDSECRVEFTVSPEGKPTKIAADCAVSDYNPHVVKAMEATSFEPQLINNTPVPTPLAQKFALKYEAAAEAKAKPPVATSGVNAKTIRRAFEKHRVSGECKATMTVTAEGKQSGTVVACTPDVYTKEATRAVESLAFKPGEKDGKAVEWPGFEYVFTIGEIKN